MNPLERLEVWSEARNSLILTFVWQLGVKARDRTIAAKSSLAGLRRFLESEPEPTAAWNRGAEQDVSALAGASLFPERDSALTRIAIDQWRLERRIQRLEATTPDANVAGISDSAQRIGESLQELGVTTLEHDGATHDPGALYEVVHIRDECDTQVVVETIAPSVLINGKIVKHGQVVIGCERTEESGT